MEKENWGVAFIYPPHATFQAFSSDDFIYITMLLSYETSSVAYDAIDLIHGKFIPASHPNFSSGSSGIDCITLRPTSPDIRIFVNIYGVFADLSSNFAHRYDRLKLPLIDTCLLDPEYISTQIPKSGTEAIMEEDEFWKHIEPYKWYMIVMEELYNLCAGDYYLILPLYDGLQVEDRLTWVWRHFGNGARSKTVLLNHRAATNLLIKNRNDLFISGDLKQCEDWSLAGGSSFWWPEIAGSCEEPAKLLTGRVKLLSHVVADLRDLSK